jgi:hypothetical protein
MKIDQKKLLAHAASLSDKKLVLWLVSRTCAELNVLATQKLVDRATKIFKTRKDLVALSDKFHKRKLREESRKWRIKVHGAIVPGTENNVVPRVDLDKLGKGRESENVVRRITSKSES